MATTTRACSFYSIEPDSVEAGRQAGRSLVDQFKGQPIKAVLVYVTVNHEQGQILEGLRAALGADVLVVGCSVQGVVVDGQLTEEGFALGAMAFGGDKLTCATAVELDFATDTRAKGRALTRSLKRKLGTEPKVVVTIYDPLCGADVEALLSGMRDEVSCPIVGGAASQPWGPLVQTFQYANDQVLSHAAIALALGGPFTAEIGMSHGTSPTGIRATVTKSSGPMVLEIDGRPAVDVWREATGCERSEMVHQSHNAAWALGVERRYQVMGPHGPKEETARMMRCAFGFDMEKGGVVFQVPIPEGTHVMFHHRTVENVLGGSEAMAGELTQLLGGRSPFAVLGFECGARTYPFLGPAATLSEHQGLRAAVAPRAPWLGMMAWGEIGPCAGEPGFHNFTYPMLLLVDAPA
jgi:hypothetical protein